MLTKERRSQSRIGDCLSSFLTDYPYESQHPESLCRLDYLPERSRCDVLPLQLMQKSSQMASHRTIDEN